MQAEDRIIHFSVELIHRPVQYKKETLQKLYFDLSQTKAGSYDSTDFTNPIQPRFYSRRGPKSQSVAVFLPDRVLLLEEWADMPLSDFIEKVRHVGARACAARGIQRYIAHTATIRSTFALTHFDDARIFLLDHAFAQQDKIGPHFQRPIATGGLRLVFPESNEHKGTMHVAIESFRHSRNEVFTEVKGIFGREQTSPDDIEIILDNIRYVRQFISERVYPYVDQFDRSEDDYQ